MARDSIVTTEEALAAYDTLKMYCIIQTGCEDCLFVSACPNNEKCIFEQKEVPQDWQELEIKF